MEQVAMPVEESQTKRAETKPQETKQDWMKQKQLATPVEEPTFDSPLAAASSTAPR